MIKRYGYDLIEGVITDGIVEAGLIEYEHGGWVKWEDLQKEMVSIMKEIIKECIPLIMKAILTTPIKDVDKGGASDSTGDDKNIEEIPKDKSGSDIHK